MCVAAQGRGVTPPMYYSGTYADTVRTTGDTGVALWPAGRSSTAVFKKTGVRWVCLMSQRTLMPKGLQPSYLITAAVSGYSLLTPLPVNHLSSASHCSLAGCHKKPCPIAWATSHPTQRAALLWERKGELFLLCV